MCGILVQSEKVLSLQYLREREHMMFAANNTRDKKILSIWKENKCVTDDAGVVEQRKLQ